MHLNSFQPNPWASWASTTPFPASLESRGLVRGIFAHFAGKLREICIATLWRKAEKWVGSGQSWCLLLPIFRIHGWLWILQHFSQLKIHCEWYDGASKTESTFWGGNSQSESTFLEKNVPSKDWGNFVVPDAYEQHMLGPRTGATVAMSCSSNRTTRRQLVMLVMLVNGGFGCGKQQLCLCVCVVAWMLGWLMFHLGCGSSCKL